jgi:single-stranded-DNA-specific exonuclease
MRLSDEDERMLATLIEAMERAIFEVRKCPDKTVQIFHHNDADGLCSGAILTRAFEREGYVVNRFCLEKPYPKLLQEIYKYEGRILIFADFAGRIAPMLSDLNKGRNLTLILDHHVAKASTDPKVHNLDPELYGLKGDRDITASATCFFFARTMNPDNVDMAPIAALGAVGDKFFVDGRLAGQNYDVAMEAARQGKVEIREHATGEHYFLKSSKGLIPCDELGVYLDILGGAGYYRKGPDMGVKVCLEGVSMESDQMVEELKAIKERAFENEIKRIRAGDLRNSTHIQWFHVEDRFSPMGVKMVGIFCEAIQNTSLIDPQRYIAGFQVIPNEIPGFGPIQFNQVKISMRVSRFMEGEIRAGRVMGLDVLLPEATNRVGGFSDACHSLTAATTVAIGKEEMLIKEMERILGGE